ncbi:protein phosphatase 2C domain-containing protein [Herbidospora galbida]|uniref:Protein phosphatase 2C domain-containing protein n=1 Tax=Herbidospora galbida TaxID=2575442 RepID=A0A4U3M8B9_9ACTN|nr:protein phosphatase 2C domain-containing protein [Herbidospora galbida]TKK85248.1 protein phosphatase 2C domain-containing protein [Herbidospora galbida]
MLRQATGGFARPLGAAPEAARLPWRLPDEPALAGISADAVTVGGLMVRAVSLVGPAHRCEEPAVPRQDAFRLGRDTAKNHLIVAVADGMSDSRRAHLGANVAVTALVARIRADLDQGMAPDPAEVFLDAARQMAGAAWQQGGTEDDVRAAALAAVIPLRADPAGRRSVWLAGLADVGAWLHAPGRWSRLLGAPKTGLDAGQLTEFLPFHPERVTPAIVDVAPGAVLTFATDGLGDALDGTGALAVWFAERWARPPHILDYIGDVGFDAPGLLDDRTAVTVWCTP